MRFKENNGGISTINRDFTGFVKNKDNTLCLALSDLMEHPTDRGAYPLHFNFMQFSIDREGMVAQKKYTMDIKQFALIYNKVSTGIFNMMSYGNNNAAVRMVKGRGAEVILKSDKEENARFEIASVSGNIVRRSYCERAKDGTYLLPFNGLPSGVYVITVYHGKKHNTVKVLWD